VVDELVELVGEVELLVVERELVVELLGSFVRGARSRD
jgi:hypothetical protein